MEENFPKPCKKLRYELGEMPCIDIIVKLYGKLTCAQLFTSRLKRAFPYFVERGLDHVIEQIVINLDYLSLTRAENVSRSWHFILSSSRIWEMFVKTKVSYKFSSIAGVWLFLNTLFVLAYYWPSVIQEDF